MSDIHSEWQVELDELQRRRDFAAEQGGADAVERQHAKGRLTIRERIDRLCDKGSFAEIGRLAGRGDYGPDGTLAHVTPANFVFGQASIDERPVVVGGYDFTVRGGASDASVGEKRPYSERMAHDLRIPLVRLVEGAGGSVKSIENMGVSYVPNISGWEWSVRNLSRVPVVAAALGPVAGLPAAEVSATHFSVIVKGAAQVFIAGPPLVEAATRQAISKEDLGGWEVVTRSGSVDNTAEDEDDALQQVRRFLSYLPSNVWELPPVHPGDDDPTRTDPSLRDLVPKARRRPHDVRKLMRSICDEGSVFEIAPRYGRAAVGVLARLDGHPVAVLGTDARFDGGGLAADSAAKVSRFVDLADTFHLPVVYLVDNPGLLIGAESERSGTLRAGCRTLSAIYEAEIPWASVLVRRAFGVAGATHRDPSRHTLRVAWPSGSWGSLPLEGGVEAAYKSIIESSADPEAARAELFARLEAMRSPFRTAEAFMVEDVIDPAETRPILCRWVRDAYRVMAAGGPKPSGRTFRP
jgi:acetyl-CoA carboxylase carboxyltransferase component